MCIKYCGTNSCSEDCPCGRHDPIMRAGISKTRRIQERDPEFKAAKEKRMQSPEYREKHQKALHEFMYTDEYKQKQSEAQKKRYSEVPFKEESRIKLSKSQKERWESLEEKQKFSATRKRMYREGIVKGGMELLLSGKNGSHMSLSEERLLPVLQIFGFENNNIADNKLALKKRVPDFWNGAEQVIEMFGCYWHGCYDCFPEGSQVHCRDNPQNRIDFLNSFGYDCLVIWEHDIPNIEYIQTLVREYVL
jgi:hypothetical protein